MEWGAISALSGLLGVLAGSIVTGVVQLRGIKATVKDNEAARQAAEQEARAQRDHERSQAEAERQAASAAIEAERAEQARQAKRVEVLEAHEAAIAELRRLVAHEEIAVKAWQYAPDTPLWVAFQRDVQGEIKAARAVAKVRLVCDPETAIKAQDVLYWQRRCRESNNGPDIESNYHTTVRRLDDYEQGAADEAMEL